MKTARCRYCGREVIYDDAAQTVSHEAPECSTFKAAVAALGPSTRTESTRAELPELYKQRAAELKKGRN